MFFIAMAFGADMEGIRLAGELESMMKENKWVGVEKMYVRLVQKHPQELTAAHHLAGAEAAKNRGDLLTAAQRLSRIPNDSEEFIRARADLDLLRHQTRLVVIDQPGNLVSESAPFNPALRAGSKYASDRLAEDGVFVGLLPSGQYTLDGRPFTVSAGFEMRVVRPQGAAVQTPAAPSPTAPPEEEG